MLRKMQRNLHMFLDNNNLRIAISKLSLGKTVLQLQSQIGQRMADLVHKMTLKKKLKKPNKQKQKKI